MGSYDFKKRMFMTEEKKIEFERLDKMEEQMNAEIYISKKHQKVLTIDKVFFLKKHLLLKEMITPNHNRYYVSQGSSLNVDILNTRVQG